MRFRIAALALLTVFAAGLTLPSESYAQNCRQLRWACENKAELGLQGAGTCRRYREICGGGSHQMSHCDKLRYACEHKGELGIQGAGSCRRYRETCGGY
jgi:hypothetical protein